MATRFQDFNLNGEEKQTLTGEVNSGYQLYVQMPLPEHKALSWHLAKIDQARLALAQEGVEETDEDFFDFGEDEFTEPPSPSESLASDFNDWKTIKEAQALENQNKPANEPAVTSKDAPAGEKQE